MFGKPQEEHAWLETLLGNWSFEGECQTGEGQESAKSTGTTVCRSLGGLWVLLEGEGSMPGSEEVCESLMTLGYDPQKERFIGSFTAGVMTHMWIYAGTLDAERKTLTLDTEGPRFDQPGMAQYQDIIEIAGPDHWMLSSRVLQDDGSWVKFMTGHYRRA